MARAEARRRRPPGTEGGWRVGTGGAIGGSRRRVVPLPFCICMRMSVFTAILAFNAAMGDPLIIWLPELSPAEAAKRKYTVSAKKRMTDPDWIPVDGNAADYNFFRVSVEMR